MAGPLWVLPVAIVAAADAKTSYTARELYLIQSLTFQSAASEAALKRSYSAQLEAQKRAIASRDVELRRLRADGAAKGAKAVAANARADALEREITTQKAAFNAALTAKEDANFAREQGELIKAGNNIVKTAPGARALEVYVAGGPNAARNAIAQLGKNSVADKRAIASLASDALAKGELTTDEAIMRWEAVVAADPQNHWDWVELSRLYIANNRLADAARAAEKAAETAVSERDRSVAAIAAGNISMLRGDLGGAATSYQRASEIDQRRVGREPRSLEAQDDLAVSYEKVGKLLSQQQNISYALDFYKKSLSIRENILSADPASFISQRKLTVILDRIGDALLLQNDNESAFHYFSRSLDIRKRLAKVEPSSHVAQSDVAAALERVASVFSSRGDTKKALLYLQRSLNIRERLASLDTFTAETQRSLSVGLFKVGTMLSMRGDLSGAIDYCQRSLAIQERLAAINPTSAQAQRDVFFTLGCLGFAGAPGHPWQRALRQYQAMEARGMIAPVDERFGKEAKRQAAAEAAAGR